MFIHEYAALTRAKERMDHAARCAELKRALRLAKPQRRSARVRLGLVLVRLGWWLIGGKPLEKQGIRVRLERTEY